jgi:hypothetical protein
LLTDFNEKRVGPQLGATFSQTHLVTLLPGPNFLPTGSTRSLGIVQMVPIAGKNMNEKNEK